MPTMVGNEHANDAKRQFAGQATRQVVGGESKSDIASRDSRVS